MTGSMRLYGPSSLAHADVSARYRRESIQGHQRTKQLTPWSKFLLKKLTVSHLVKKFPAFYKTQMFITAFTTARHLSLSEAR